MKVTPCKSGNDIIYYLSKGIRKNGKPSTVNIEIIGRHSELIRVHSDPLAYCKQYAIEKTKNEKAFLKEKFQVNLEYKIQTETSKISEVTNYNIGYFYLKHILDQLNLRSFFKEITKDSKITFSPLSVTHFLTYARILDPNSKLGTYDTHKTYYNLPDIALQDIYKTLDIISDNLDAFQTHLYHQSNLYSKRNTEILYYDCTNFFFEILGEKGMRKYGISKENRPNPIVQLGLFMDADGIPLAFNINDGNTNEQTTPISLEKKIVKEFEINNFIYVADAGLGSNRIRYYNSFNNRNYLVTQSLKKLKKADLDLILDENNWYDPITKRNDICLTDIDEKDERIFYKVLIIDNPIDIGLREYTKTNALKKKTDFKQTLIVSFNKQQQLFQREVRCKQILRAKEMIIKNRVEKTTENSPKRFIKTEDSNKYLFNDERVNYESQFDGFYAMVTSLDEDLNMITKIMGRRWQIEQSFRIMKTNFKSRPVYHQKDRRIIAHFATCFLALLVYRLLEKKLNSKYTINEILEQLKRMTVSDLNGVVFKANYKGSEILEALNKVFNKELSANLYTVDDLNTQKGKSYLK